jgi:DNA-directed RNA polymerase subunit RPC12/RpoP
MKCPYCGKEMVSGKIYGDRYQMKWMPDDKKLFLGIWVRENFIPIGTGFLGFKRPRAKAYVCLDCKKLIHDIQLDDKN